MAPETRSQLAGFAQSWQHWWHVHVTETIEQGEVIAKRREECGLTARHLFMLAMSAGIAILGLLQSSPAVVIGAMLLSPLMGPIIGIGFALAIGDYRWMRQAAQNIAVSVALSVGLCAVIVAVSPLQTVTSEIASRTRPNLFDLLIALFSALAGSYAMMRGREGSIVGVAIATALMPPLAVVGFGAATANWTVFSGAFLLFFTNLMTIALTAALMARFYGFSRALSERQTWWQTVGIILAFVALAIPLGLSLRTIAWETNAARQIRGDLGAVFAEPVRLSQVEIGFDAHPIQISATVLTPHIRTDAEAAAAKAISRAINRQVQVVLTQYQVGTSATAAEESELAAAQAREDNDLKEAQALSERLALAAGVPAEDILIDRDRRRALVDAQPLAGASLATYYALEQRIAAAEPKWQIILRPPPLALPTIELSKGVPTPNGSQALDLAAWAAKRLGLKVLVEGSAGVADRLTQAGATARSTGAAQSPAVLRWDTANGGNR